MHGQNHIKTVWYIHIRDLVVPVLITTRENFFTAEVMYSLQVYGTTRACYSTDVNVQKG